MIKKLVMALVVCSISTVNCMDMTSQQKVCLLIMLEPAIRNVIAQYLPFKDKETDAELAKRMEQEEQWRNSSNILSYMFVKSQKPASPYNNTIESYSIKWSKKLLLCRQERDELEPWWADSYHPDGGYFMRIAKLPSKITIVDIENNVETDNPSLTALVKEDSDCITHIALSPDGMRLQRYNSNLLKHYLCYNIKKQAGKKKLCCRIYPMAYH